MAFGFLGLLATLGLLVATIAGVEALIGGLGYIYALLVFAGVAVPCLVIGNYVDDLRKNAAIAQVGYSLIAMVLTAFFLVIRGTGYVWRVPLFGEVLFLEIGNLAVLIFLSQAFIILYLILNWHRVVPGEGVEVIRDRTDATLVKKGLVPSPLAPALLADDGTELSDDESERVLRVRKVATDEGIAILCSNCNGATPLSKAKDNKLVCDFCGVTLGVGNVFVPCDNHPEYLAATTCAVCGHHFCRKCLTAQEPPIDERWQGSTIFMCKTCFEGRYRPAVTTTSFVIPIDKLFATAGSRFGTVARIYRRFLGAYGKVLKTIFIGPFQWLASLGKSDDGDRRRRSGGGWGGDFGGGCGGGGGGGGGGDCDGCLGIILIIVIIIIAIPIITGILMLIGAIILIPLLFYAGLIAVTLEAVKVIRKTDFQSLDSVRIQSVIEKKQPKVKQSKMRPYTRTWEEDYFAKSRRQREIERRQEEDRRRRQRRQSDSFWGGGRGY